MVTERREEVGKRAFPWTSTERFPCESTVGGDLGERLLAQRFPGFADTEEVTGSNPVAPTIVLLNRAFADPAVPLMPGGAGVSGRRALPCLTNVFIGASEMAEGSLPTNASAPQRWGPRSEKAYGSPHRTDRSLRFSTKPPQFHPGLRVGGNPALLSSEELG